MDSIVCRLTIEKRQKESVRDAVKKELAENTGDSRSRIGHNKVKPVGRYGTWLFVLDSTSLID